ncbi:alcohol dehydrogenase catalytic domain-containing protein [Microbacterium sp. MAHUQ-60]|uniref:alcohol dehydrogenase catalytic domain-containing protein n=1 Tax=unclassified Microbacterium TaxID=2609290 RepID=UPI0036152D19
MSRTIIHETFGGPEVLQVVDEPVSQPAAGEALVRIEAFAINPLDAMMRAGNGPAGSHPAPARSRLGIEGTGVIESVGPGVTSVRVGEPVIITAIPDATVRGSHAQHTTLPVASLIHRPAQLDPTHAAAIWVGFSTAYGALVETARMRRGDRVLITGASGSVGRAALQIAERIGAEAVGVTRDGSKAGLLREAGAADVIVVGPDGLTSAIRQRDRQEGVDIVLDLVRGPGQQDLLSATRTDGTLVAAGFLDSRPTHAVPDDRVRIVDYRGFDLLADQATVRRMTAFLEDGVREGALLPALDEVFDIDHVVDAHRRFDDGLHAGRKIVVRA